MMGTPDMKIIKELPGYKVIMKAVLKSQMQQLADKLAAHTDEESVILTVSVTDGSLSHMGSGLTKGFLEENEDIRSKFLAFCLKQHHRKAQEDKEEKERQEAEARQASMMAKPVRMSGPPGPYGMRSPRYQLPRGAPPVSVMRASPGNRMAGSAVRPYPKTKPQRPPLNFDPGHGPSRVPPLQNLAKEKLDEQIIKIKPDTDCENSNQSEKLDPKCGPVLPPLQNPSKKNLNEKFIKPQPDNNENGDKQVSSSQSPSHESPFTPLKVKTEANNNDNVDESSDNAIPTTETNLGLDSDLTTANTEASAKQTDHETAENETEIDPDVSDKHEALADSGMEIACVEPQPDQDSTDPIVSDTGIKLKALNESKMEIEDVETGKTMPQSAQEKSDTNVPDVSGKLEALNEPDMEIDADESGKTLLQSVQDASDPTSVSDATGKLEAVNESEMKFNGTSVESSSAMPQPAQGTSAITDSKDMNIDPTGAMGSQGDLSQQDYSSNQPDGNQIKSPKLPTKFQCQECGKYLSTKVTLSRHAKTHTGQKYQCEVCDKVFAYKQSMLTHIARVH